MQRKDLKSIYDQLDDEDKKAWANKAEYASYQGLYKYLKNNQDSEAYERLVSSLVAAVGTERFDQLASHLKAHAEKGIAPDFGDVSGLKKQLIRMVFATKDIERVETLKKDFEDIVIACENQLSRLKIEREL